MQLSDGALTKSRSCIVKQRMNEQGNATVNYILFLRMVIKFSGGWQQATALTLFIFYYTNHSPFKKTKNTQLFVPWTVNPYDLRAQCSFTTSESITTSLILITVKVTTCDSQQNPWASTSSHPSQYPVQAFIRSSMDLCNFLCSAENWAFSSYISRRSVP